MYIPYEAMVIVHHIIAGDKGGVTDIVTRLFHFYSNDPMSGAGSL